MAEPYFPTFVSGAGVKVPASDTLWLEATLLEPELLLETRQTLEESGGYNYVAGPSNAIMPGTPVENIYAMIEEIEKYKP